MSVRGLILLLLGFATSAATGDELRLPQTQSGPPAAGRRVAVALDEYDDTTVHHMLYLPNDWTDDANRSWPVIVEYTGNHFPAAGSTGEMEDAALGFGLTKGRFLWVTLPFVSPDRQANARTWWGDIEATVDYAKQVVPSVCAEYHGDPEAVFLCGFSRGAIAVNFIGLHDEEIAQLWTGFITHDHYDGVRGWKSTDWGWPVEQYQAAATKRLQRIGDRPVLICQNGGTSRIASFLNGRIPLTKITFLDIDMRSIFPEIPNDLVCHPHNDRWPLVESPYRDQVSNWFEETLRLRVDATSN
ncbi:hypothetical protein [Rubinisphaera margarita]|uniref:hypothetical protein n=1 Tax=Rubinisphaera margarita TaxID=2909586 RepID=UPI001EE90AE8|nr:hypothetical protein [Rubinisphaera margarita]MCG6156478.1 hypothetical protein [Rubinisphaera margarita]